jgi:hypothetical protein
MIPTKVKVGHSLRRLWLDRVKMGRAFRNGKVRSVLAAFMSDACRLLQGLTKPSVLLIKFSETRNPARSECRFDSYTVHTATRILSAPVIPREI